MRRGFPEEHLVIDAGTIIDMAMNSLFGSALGRLRLLGFLEGGSFLILVGIAMPLKHFAGMPGAVRMAGMAHGILFIAYCVAIVLATLQLRWSTGRALSLLVASLLPFGPFYADAKILRKLEQ